MVRVSCAATRRLAILIATIIFAICATVWNQPARASDLATYLPKLAPADFFSGADRFGPLQGDPPIVPVYRGDQLQGYV